MAAARELGVAVTVASDRAPAMSATMGERTLTLRSSSPEAAAEAIVARAQDTPFAAVVGVDDQGVMAAALAAESLGLAHNPPLAVARTRDKGRCARRWRRRTCRNRASSCWRRAAMSTPRRARQGFPACSSRCRCRAAAASSGPMIPARPWRPPNGSGPSWPPQANRATRRCCSRATCPARRSPSRACCSPAACSCWRSSTSPTHSKAPTSRRRSMSPRRGCPRRSRRRSSGPRRGRRLRSACARGRSTRSFASMARA